ncbi:Protein BUS-4 [Aphelenchoides avenae]|nr:Protein BUS-4 [Aphelenchus avenae]
MRIFAENLYNDSKLCPCADFEDMGIALCFENKRIFPSDTRDSDGRQRFLAYRLEQHRRGDKIVSGWSMDPVKEGVDGISSQLINLHHVTPDQMRLADFFLYRVRRTGTDNEGAIKSKSLDIV